MNEDEDAGLHRAADSLAEKMMRATGYSRSRGRAGRSLLRAALSLLADALRLTLLCLAHYRRR